MDFISKFKNKVFNLKPREFNSLALELFHFQANNNQIYRDYIQYLCLNMNKINAINKIPFLPIEFFKNQKISCINNDPVKIFESSGTGNLIRSKHYISDLNIYNQSLIKTFELFYGDPKKYTFLALLPSYLEKGNSSLIYMVSELIKNSNSKFSGFFNYDYENLQRRINESRLSDTKVFLIGVSYALLEFAKIYPQSLNDIIILETGGMKGFGKEMPREELHNELKEAFNISEIHSEYGMTELLSQAYSKGNGIFNTPKWMKIFIRDLRDPFQILNHSENGAINIIDLANIESCAFIETQDLGKINKDASFEVTGRMDNTAIRGCNLIFA